MNNNPTIFVSHSKPFKTTNFLVDVDNSTQIKLTKDDAVKLLQEKFITKKKDLFA